MQIEERAQLATAVFTACVDNSDTFEGDDNLGANVAYLMGAILKGERFEASHAMHAPFVALLCAHFAPSHAVWRSIDLMGDDSSLPSSVKRNVLTCARKGQTLGSVDAEDYPSAGVWVDRLTVKP